MLLQHVKCPTDVPHLVQLHLQALLIRLLPNVIEENIYYICCVLSFFIGPESDHCDCQPLSVTAHVMNIFLNSCLILWLPVFHVLCQYKCFSSVALCSSELPVWRRIWRLEGTWTSSASNTHAAIYFTAKIIKTYIIVGIKNFKNGLLIGTSNWFFINGDDLSYVCVWYQDVLIYHL